MFTRALSGFAGLEISLNNFRNVDPAALAATSLEAVEDNLLFIQYAEVLWNTSDPLLNPTRGVQVRGRFDHSTTALLSDTSFARLVLEGRHYQRL